MSEQTHTTKPIVATTPEERAKIVADLIKTGRKLVSFTPPLSGESAQRINTTLTLLKNLKEKISLFAAEVKDQSDTIAQRLEKLKDEPSLTLDIDIEQAGKSVEKYTGLLERINEEITHEEGRLASYAALEQPTLLPVYMQEPDDFDQFIAVNVNRIKKQSKKIEKDLMVSYSRYQFSFKGHLKQIEQVEKYVMIQKRLEAMQKEQKAEQAS